MTSSLSLLTSRCLILMQPVCQSSYLSFLTLIADSIQHFLLYPLEKNELNTSDVHRNHSRGTLKRIIAGLKCVYRLITANSFCTVAPEKPKNLSCIVHQVSRFTYVMTCTWNPGRHTFLDTQFRLRYSW